MRVARRGGGHDARFQVQVNINGGGEHGGVGPLQYFGKLVVEGSEECGGIVRQVGKLFHQAPEHGGDQGGADAVPHHVADDGPTPESPTGKASNQSPATPSEGVKMWWKSAFRVTPRSVREREGARRGAGRTGFHGPGRFPFPGTCSVLPGCGPFPSP